MKLCATQALRRIGGVVNGCAYGTARKNAILAAHKHIFYYFCKTLKKKLLCQNTNDMFFL